MFFVFIFYFDFLSMVCIMHYPRLLEILSFNRKTTLIISQKYQIQLRYPFGFDYCRVTYKRAINLATSKFLREIS